MRPLLHADALNGVRRDMDRICTTIGNRLAGSPREKEAAEYVASRFTDMGLENVSLLPFACRRWVPGGGELIVLGQRPRSIECQVVTHSPATPPEGVEGDLMIFEPADWECGLPGGDYTGKIGLFHGGYGESAEVFAQLQNSALVALLFVDTRLQTDWPVANGMGEKFQRMARKPMAYISLMDAWELTRSDACRVRLTTRGEIRNGVSHNVVAELPGSRADARIIVVCAHIDSVSVGVGADDDASGVAAVLECARLLREKPRLHTVRFIGFGAEEQLSVGSCRYVSEQVKDLERIDFVCNFDGVGAWIGLSEAMVTGTPLLEAYARQCIEQRHRWGVVNSNASPYQDTFAFCARGIPGVWFTRKTHLGAYWYHHSVHNDLPNYSTEQIAWTAAVASEVLAELLALEHWPFAREISSDLALKVSRYQRELFE